MSLLLNSISPLYRRLFTARLKTPAPCRSAAGSARVQIPATYPLAVRCPTFERGNHRKGALCIGVFPRIGPEDKAGARLTFGEGFSLGPSQRRATSSVRRRKNKSPQREVRARRIARKDLECSNRSSLASFTSGFNNYGDRWSIRPLGRAFERTIDKNKTIWTLAENESIVESSHRREVEKVPKFCIDHAADEAQGAIKLNDLAAR